MGLTEQEQRIERDALAFARSNKKRIARRITDTTKYLPEAKPVSVFMAGSPGAGKTEASIELLSGLDGPAVLRIDPDELRHEFQDYIGGNAYLFQKAVSVLVEKIHDMALKRNQSFLLDGTLSNYDKAHQNITRSLNKGRLVQILYVYQDPLLAWSFVQARELKEGRRIREKDFVNQYFEARAVVNRLKKCFGGEIKVDLLLKNNDNSQRFYRAGVDQIDNHIPERYSEDDIVRLIDRQ